MTTPTRSQMASTPKNAISLTPGKNTASPRTNLGSFGHKTTTRSPAVKTPVSISHAHKGSLSSHPAQTPLASSTLPDDIMNMSTPAAMLAAMGNSGMTGLTPLPATDGLGILSAVDDGSLSSVHVKNPQKERHEKLQEVASILKAKARGRGVTRNNIQTIAKIYGFEGAFDENTLNLGGSNIISLDLEFDHLQKDLVRKVTFTLSENDDDIVQHDASEVLKRNLTGPSDKPWHDLSDFQQNLAYLSHIERVSETNAFKLVDNLYDCFQRIWVEEKKRMKWRQDAHHICQSNIGRPIKDADRKLGLRAQYWADGIHFWSQDEYEANDGYHAKFSVNKGPPAITDFRDWLADNTLNSTTNAEDIFQDTGIDRPAWQHVPSSKSALDAVEDAMNLDDNDSKYVNAHFVCDLDPPIYLSSTAVNQLNKDGQLAILRQDQVTNFHRFVAGDVDENEPIFRRQYIFDEAGNQSEKMHEYTLSSNQSWACRVSRLQFTHPQQYAQSVLVLRQYAVVNELLKSLAPSESVKPKFKPESAKSAVQAARPRTTKRSNKPKIEKELDQLMNLSRSSTIPIDVQLDAITSQTSACCFTLTVPIARLSDLTKSSRPFLEIQILVLFNGLIEVADIAGLALEKSRIEELKKRLAKVVRACQDIGMAVNWLLQQLK